MSHWENIKEAEIVATKNKPKNYGVTLHKKYFMKNLVEIQQSVINHEMKTSEYKYQTITGGHGKERNIAKLDFHPSHIQHQLLVLASQDILDKSFINDTYASRCGRGQHACAKRCNQFVQKYKNKYSWYLQLDIKKYYDSIPHWLIREKLEHKFKDKEYIDKYMEPIEKYHPNGIGIPLGIRPSQIFGNLALDGLDRMIKEELHVHCYLRYLDDMVLLAERKKDCWKYYNIINEYLKSIGFELHPPKVSKIEHGIDFMGYVIYPDEGMFMRKCNKVAWLKRRHHLKNPERIREVDSAAWGILKHGNKDCKYLYKKYTKKPTKNI